MKTFRELISWELEQESKRKRAALSLSEEGGNTKLSASMLRKMRYLSTAGVVQKDAGEGLSVA
jgi:hypothetical protein